MINDNDRKTLIEYRLNQAKEVISEIDGDYAPFTEFSKPDVIDMQKDMKVFIERIELFINTRYK